MKRRIIIIGAAVAAATGAGIAAMPGAQAQSVCIAYDLNLNGQGQAGELCLPPDGGGTPELPELPGLPTLP